MTAPSTRAARFIGVAIPMLALLLGALPAAAQTVRWEDYRGDSSRGTGLTNVTYTGRAGAPSFDYTLDGVDALIALAASPANAVRTGSSALIDFGDGIDNGLCDNRTAAGRSTSACANHAMGKVIYSLVRFPRAGTYNLAVAHDDAVQVNLSSQYTSTNYRAASYDIAVGALSSYTAGENAFRTIGSFTAATDNSCALIRMYWVNAGRLNFNRLRWQHPAINGGTEQIIPAAQFRDPASESSAVGCQGTVVFPVPAIMINKNVAGRIAAEDQFTVAIVQGNNVLRAASTSGSGSGQQASTGAIQVGTGTYTLRDAMAAGSLAAIGDYSKSINCSAYRVTDGAEQAVTATGTGPDWSLNVAANTQYTCTIVNTARPAITLRKISEGGIGTFSFTGSNGVNAHSITTGSAGQAVSGKPQVFASLNTATTVTETVAAGFSLTGVQCTGLPAGVAATVDLANRRLSLPAAAAVQGASIVCTFNNKAGAELSISKSNALSSLVAGTTTQYNVVANNGGPGAADGAVLRDTPIAGLKNCAVATCSFLNNASCPASPADLLTPAGAAVPSFPAGGQVTFIVQCEVE